MTGILKRKFAISIGLLALLCALVCPTGRADDIGLGDLTISIPTISGMPGQQLIVGGILMNSSTSALYFVNESLNFTSLTVLFQQTDVVLNAFDGGPGSIDGGATLPVLDLFRFTIPDGTPPGMYDLNSYDLLGGTDPNCTFDCVILGTGSFTLNVQGTVPTPEPGTLLLLASGLLAGLLVVRRAAL